ncbi:unnamed protein product [Pseudo-nitzschia multistriata]|uniref:Vacuolar protein sorting-associated protein 54 C-terminal domain-containing protein n=1 Tax=Pseudo-nitzschia multistriata TaxID=183589 RepID=A0A448Z1D8_9STRA|nr:unnamed protein product [Pseudo-nitzschia multistriata]
MTPTPPPHKGVEASASARPNATGFRLPNRDERDRATREAEECLEATKHESGFQLDGFNLLGVVANPRSGGAGATVQQSAATTTTPGEGPGSRQPPGAVAPPGQAQAPHPPPQPPSRAPLGSSSASASSADQQHHGMFSDAVQTFEDTLAHVAEQIESLNLFLEQLSRQYLGDDTDEALYLEYYYQNEEEDETHPMHMMRADNIPPELVNLELQEMQYYLEECGVLAHTLVAQGLNTRTLHSEDVVDQDRLNQQLEDIPSVFYETDFDLTDARTFAELLLRQDGNETKTEHDGAPGDETTTKPTNSLYQPTQELIPVREQEFLAGHLDRVELALQEQVRQKSTAFFQETTRFQQLQSSIVDLLRQVQNLRACMQQALGVYRQTKDISDHQRQDYEILVDLLDGSMELVRCKASIGGLLSANDHLGAALQIQYGRRLLNGSSGIEEGAEDAPGASSDDNPAESSGTGNAKNGNGNSHTENHHHDHNDDAATLELRLLTALSSTGAQFTQYESLVVQSLSDELVELFFHWRPSERERVLETAEALQICGAVHKTSELYQRRLQQMIRMTVRTTIAEFMESSSSSVGSNKSSGGVTGMTYPAFYNCLQLLIEEIKSILVMAHRVDEFCASEAIFGEISSPGNLNGSERWTKEAVVQAAELATNSIAELLRLRKEAHSVISLSEMKQLWDTCTEFATKMEDYSNQTRAVSLRSTLVGQAKSFLDRTHESNMSTLVSALDSERWSQCEVSNERQAALTRLCTGLATVSTPLRNLQQNGDDDQKGKAKNPVAVVEGVNYKVVWSCLLLIEMIMTNLSSAAYFQRTLATNAVTKVVELMRLFNARATNLVLGAGAIHSAARLKSINAKHLSYVTQCLGMTISLLPHIRAALMAQLPAKQHGLLIDLDSIKSEYKDHNEKVLNKFVSIIGGIVEHGLAPRIASVDFDDRAKKQATANEEDVVECFVFLDGISSSTRKLHTVLNALLPPDHLQDVFSRIFAHLDEHIPKLFVAAVTTGAFTFPSSDAGKNRLLTEVGQTTKTLNGLSGVLPWDFTAINVLERKLDYKLPALIEPTETQTDEEITLAINENEEIAEAAAQGGRTTGSEKQVSAEGTGHDDGDTVEPSVAVEKGLPSETESAKNNLVDDSEGSPILNSGENTESIATDLTTNAAENGERGLPSEENGTQATKNTVQE